MNSADAHSLPPWGVSPDSENRAGAGLSSPEAGQGSVAGAVAVAASVPRRLFGALASGADWTFGLFSLVLGLAIFSVLPLLNFLSLGYLIHVSARVATTGRLRDGWVGVRKASRLGSFVAGAWLVMLPVRFVSGLWKDAELIAPGGRPARLWHAGLIALAVAAAVQIIWACFRGGRLRHFLWPAPVRFVRWLKVPGKLPAMRRVVVEFMAGLRLPYYFWLGARGFAGALLWLALPVGLLFAAAQLAPDKGGGVLSFLGGVLLAPVVAHLPFLQTHFGVENRFGALFEVGGVRRMFQRAPWAFVIALVSTLLFALPLYLLKVELPPRELAWLPSVVFVVFILPARFLIGWAVGRAARRERPRHGFFRWTGRLAVAPVALLYVLLVYFTQFLSWNGTRGLLEQHAFMVPAPLTSL